jgi:hypothetical protein
MISAKYRLKKRIDIGKNRYRLGKNIGIGKNIGSEKISVSAQPISV